MSRALTVTVGDRYSRLIVLKLIGKINTGGCSRRLWLCQCDCGKQVTLTSKSLNSKNEKSITKSCGCLRREIATALGRTHKGRKPWNKGASSKK